MNNEMYLRDFLVLFEAGDSIFKSGSRINTDGQKVDRSDIFEWQRP